MEISERGSASRSLMFEDFLKLVAPSALISAGVTVWINQRHEAVRARRDYNTKRYDLARDEVKKAAEAAVEYFAVRPQTDRNALQESRILVGEREVRSSVTILIGVMTSMCALQRANVSKSLVEFMADLTGGSFQQTDSYDSDRDREQILRIANGSAVLRQALSELRDSELENAIAKGIGASIIDWVGIYRRPY